MGLRIRHGALDGVPLLQDCLFPVLPLCIGGGCDEKRFKAESQRGFVVETNGDSEVVSFGGDFHEANQFVPNFGKVLSYRCTLDVSQFAPPSAIWSGVHLRSNAGASRSHPMAVQSDWQENSYLPKNSTVCPKSLVITGLIRQSQSAACKSCIFWRSSGSYGSGGLDPCVAKGPISAAKTCIGQDCFSYCQPVLDNLQFLHFPEKE